MISRVEHEPIQALAPVEANFFPQAQDLLTHLQGAPETLFTYEELEPILYGSGYRPGMVSSQNLRNHLRSCISSARKAISQEAELYSLRGGGYFLWPGSELPATLADLGVSIFTHDTSEKKAVSGISVLPSPFEIGLEVENLRPLFDQIVFVSTHRYFKTFLVGRQRAILACLAANFGEVCSPEAIEAFWRPENISAAEQQPPNIAWYITRLRKSLGQDSPYQVVNVYGQGYSLVKKG